MKKEEIKVALNLDNLSIKQLLLLDTNKNFTLIPILNWLIYDGKTIRQVNEKFVKNNHYKSVDFKTFNKIIN